MRCRPAGLASVSSFKWESVPWVWLHPGSGPSAPAPAVGSLRPHFSRVGTPHAPCPAPITRLARGAKCPGTGLGRSGPGRDTKHAEGSLGANEGQRNDPPFPGQALVQQKTRQRVTLSTLACKGRKGSGRDLGAPRPTLLSPSLSPRGRKVSPAVGAGTEQSRTRKGHLFLSTGEATQEQHLQPHTHPPADPGLTGTPHVQGRRGDRSSLQGGGQGRSRGGPGSTLLPGQWAGGPASFKAQGSSLPLPVCRGAHCWCRGAGWRGLGRSSRTIWRPALGQHSGGHRDGKGDPRPTPGPEHQVSSGQHPQHDCPGRRKETF